MLCGFLRGPRRLDSLLVELCGRAEDLRHDLVGRQVGDAGDVAEVALVIAALVPWNQSALPEDDVAVLLERSHAAEHALVLEVGRAPFHCLHDVRTRFVHSGTDAREAGPGKPGRFRDVRVDALITLPHSRFPRTRRSLLGAV